MWFTMLKIGNSPYYLKVQILNRKLQAENTTKFSFNRDLSVFKLTIWNDISSHCAKFLRENKVFVFENKTVSLVTFTNTRAKI